MNAQEKVRLVERVCKDFEGNAHDLERAIGVLFVGQHFGWRVLYLIHDKKTLKKYEDILSVEFRSEFPERGSCAHKSVALGLADKLGNFWKAVKGQVTGIRTSELMNQ